MTASDTNDANAIHQELFPEEYDFQLDSSVDLKDRRAGINPMSQEYIEERNRLRRELGFDDYDCREGPCAETFLWVREMLASGRHDELQALLEARRQVQASRLQQERQEEADFRLSIDEVDKAVADRKFVCSKIEPGSPEAFAFAALGLVPTRFSALTHVQNAVRERYPEFSDERREGLIRTALDRWTEIYCSD